MTGDSVPLEDEVEVTLLGPGYGESVVVHLGRGAWIVVDSCIDDAGEPQALEYLHDMDVDPATAVKLVVATHWHDDHIRGMAELLKICRSATFCCASALRQKEFLGAVDALDGHATFSGSSGVSEIHAVLSEISSQQRTLKWAIADRLIHAGEGYRVWALSPRDSEFARFLSSVGSLIPRQGQTKNRVPNVSPNDASVVLWIRAADVRVLLGADMQTTGWTGIIASAERPQERASVFKVSHHGAASGDEPEIWKKMLEPDPVAVLTPWCRGGRAVPTGEDAQRILSRTDRAWTTARTERVGRVHKRHPAVESSLREDHIRRRRIGSPAGGVRLRRRVGAASDWSVAPFGEACSLQAVATQSAPGRQNRRQRRRKTP